MVKQTITNNFVYVQIAYKEKVKNQTQKDFFSSFVAV